MIAKVQDSMRQLLSSDASGATIVEFALIAPVFFGIIMFIFDAAYLLYARAMLDGEVAAIGRSSTLETANDAMRSALDAQLANRMRLLVPHGTLAFDRVAFNRYGFAQSRAEPFVDNNNNNRCDDAESFLDLNGNSGHDLDGGRAGGGGARDVVIYTVTLRYDRFFPVESLFGLDPEVSLQAKTLLRNQPFDQQSQPITRVCA